jgi:hypothetical protein
VVTVVAVSDVVVNVLGAAQPTSKSAIEIANARMCRPYNQRAYCTNFNPWDNRTRNPVKGVPCGFRLPHFPFELETPGAWLAEAGLSNFRAPAPSFRSTPDATLVQAAADAVANQTLELMGMAPMAQIIEFRRVRSI